MSQQLAGKVALVTGRSRGSCADDRRGLSRLTRAYAGCSIRRALLWPRCAMMCPLGQAPASMLGTASPTGGLAGDLATH
jgi:hypothetical protein